MKRTETGAKRRFRQRRANPSDSSAGWSRLQIAAVARLLQRM